MNSGNFIIIHSFSPSANIKRGVVNIIANMLDHADDVWEHQKSLKTTNNTWAIRNQCLCVVALENNICLILSP